VLTFQKFGLTNGKQGWKVGVSFLKRPILFELEDSGDFGFGSCYAGSAQIATNQSILVTVSDDIDSADWDRNFPLEENGMGLRDAYSLNYFRTVSSPIVNWNVAICGKPGSEVIVTSNALQIAARRGNEVQQLSLEGIDPDFNAGTSTTYDGGHGIPLLGCETHLILTAFGKIYLFQTGQEKNLLSLQQSLSVDLESDRIGNPENICWSPDNCHFAFSYKESNCISVWKLDTAAGEMEPVQRVQVEATLCVKTVALAESFVVASCNEKKLHVFDRKGGQKVHTLCDVNCFQQLDADELVYPLALVTMGDLLITSSHIGNALCIWNLKTGQLLKRHNDALAQRMTDELPDGTDVTDMVYLKRLNAFATMNWSTVVRGFPTNEKTKKMLLSIRRRERNISRVQLGFGQGEMVGDSGSEIDSE
jgi:WD40 repeat protein